MIQSCMSRRGRTAVALVLSLGLAAPAAAQTVIGGYQAYIGPADLRNSRGVALSQPWQVIRQDRANVHRFGIQQPGDQRDPWFGSADMRAALENWARYGGLDGVVGAQVMAGGVSLYVEVLGQGTQPSGIRVNLGQPGFGGGAPGVGDGPIISPE